MTAPAIAVVVVTYRSADCVERLVRTTREQMRPGDELVVVDNASDDGTADLARAVGGEETVVVDAGGNLGFARGVNVGASHATAPLVLLLNPDAVLLDGALDGLRATAASQPSWGAWQSLVVLPGGDRINVAGGRTHYLGFGWAGDWEEPVSKAPAGPSPVGFASGAAMCVRRDAWDAVGGMEDSFFMYGEDLELSLRLRLAGWEVGVAPSSLVEHDYEFDKGNQKWFYLERNRWSTVLVCYPLPLLVLLLPVLLAFELALVPVAARGGWLEAKRRAVLAALGRLPATLRRRRRVQRSRRISSAAFARGLTAQLDGAVLAPVAEQPLLDVPQRLYWRAVVALLSLGARDRRTSST